SDRPPPPYPRPGTPGGGGRVETRVAVRLPSVPSTPPNQRCGRRPTRWCQSTESASDEPFKILQIGAPVTSIPEVRPASGTPWCAGNPENAPEKSLTLVQGQTPC